jgi:hypothetical protein
VDHGGVNVMNPSIPSTGNQAPGMQGPGNTVFSDFGNAMNMGGLTGTAFTHFGSQFIGKGQNLVNVQYSKNFSLLKYYFNVNNSYVINKIKLLLFPLRHVYWKRRIHKQNEGEVFLPPRDDINAPDLYIPTMAFITYVLILGFVWGTSYKFTPEVLGTTASKGLFVLAIESLLVKFGFYLLNSSLPILDIVAYCGYKYVGIVLTMLGGYTFGSYAFYSLYLVTSLFMAIFLVKALKVVFPELTNYTPTGPDNLRKYFLLAVGALQFIFSYYLAYDTHLVSSY